MSSSSVSFTLPSARPGWRYQPVKASTRQPDGGDQTASNSDTAEVKTSEISLTTKDNKTIKAYMAIPKLDPAPKAGIVLFSDVFGYESPETRKVADYLASHSLPTIVPDLFRENPWPMKPLDDTFMDWLKLHPFDRIHDDITVALSTLQENGYGEPFGILGFCLGGALTMYEIGQRKGDLDPAAAVAFYPSQFDAELVGSKAKAPLLFIAGDNDPLIPSEAIEKLRDTLDSNNEEMPDCEMVIVKGAGHGFAHRPTSEEDKIDGSHLLERAMQWLRKFLLPN